MAAEGRHHRRWIAAALAAVVAMALAVHGLRFDWRAYRILSEYLAVAGGAAPLPVVLTDPVTLPDAGGGTPARLYLPAGAAHPRGIVLLHGMDPAGIDEPRLVDFARVLAHNGFAVLTPQLASLADFRLDAQTIATMGASAAWLQQRLQSGPVALLGLSFAGSLALLAAARPEFAPHIRVVVSVGGYDRLTRVARFLLTGATTTPAGAAVRLAPNPYGALLYVAMHARQFFPAAAVGAAQAALDAWLAHHPRQAMAELSGLDPPQQALVQDLFAGRWAPIRPRLLATLAALQPEMDALSPAGQLGGLRVPVFLLQGADDNVIPWTELLWLRRDLPAAALRRSLLTPAMQHVNPELGPWPSRLALIRFFAAALRTASD